MGKTIEERGKAIAERSSAETQAEKEYYYAGYVLGATEQKEIMDKAMDMLNETCCNIIKLEKSHLIRKACDARCKLCWCEINKACPYDNRDECYTRNNFRKTLEE